MSIGIIRYSYGNYTGTQNDVRKQFNLTHKNVPIFQRYFDGSNSSVVSVLSDTIRIPNHFYVTGEEIEYSYIQDGFHEPVGIGTTFISGIGNTDKLPATLYVVKINDLDIQLAASVSDSLKTIPKVLDITSVGIGSSHIFTSKNQNKKVIIGIDNLIQSPIISSSTTTFLSKNVNFFDSELFVSDPSLIYSGDLIKIDNEIMKVSSVGIGSTNSVSIIRSWLGTFISTHSSSSVVTKVLGNYNIVDNTICFADAPYGQVPIPNQFENNPDEVDYVGIKTGSSFSGRVFLRSGYPDTSSESYSNNYIIDDISDQFDGYKNTFSLESNNASFTGVSTDNAILLVNGIFQTPNSNTSTNDYVLTETSGITSVSFSGVPLSNDFDINVANIPRGGIILSVGSTYGLGYQPLVAAGGTAIVSSAGTIQSISIGNSGSGYRVGIQTIVNVGVYTGSTGIPNIEFIGTASISDGHVIGVAITNPGIGYTSSNLPRVVFDSPLSYTNIPLVYSSQSIAGVGTAATIDIVVGQGSSVISFELTNLGYRYERGDILTVDIGGSTGIPTDTSIPFSEFQILVDNIHSDSFSAWTIGSLQVIDALDSLFDGNRTRFPILINGNQTTIRAKKGSNIDVQATLLIFINDVLQVPGKSYIFNGGSNITFTEAPKEGDKSKIIFYRGTADLDTLDVDILETIKVGDNVTLKSDDINLSQNGRLVTNIVSSDVINTNLYSGPGISSNQNLLRPLTWCKQTFDLVINGNPVNKDRIIYEPYIQPVTNIIQNVGIGSTYIFVEGVKAFFDSEREYLHNGTIEKPQNKILIVSQDTIISAAATAVVSASGTISSIILSDNGVGYTTDPSVSISNPTDSTGVATAVATIADGSVSSISVIDGGFGYNSAEPPSVLIESPVTKYEIVDGVSYEGDFGIITGINTVSIGIALTGLVFDLFIPNDSILRDTKIVRVGVATTGISGIQTGYYFVVKNSNIGNGVTSLDDSGEVVGIGTSYIDNIYQAVSVSIGQTAVAGIGITNVTKVTVSLSDYNNLVGFGFSGFYGEYSWGRILTASRKNPEEFISYAKNSGISTSPIIKRFNRLKYIGYSTT